MKPLLASLLTLCLLAACGRVSPTPATPTVVGDSDLDHLQPDLPIFREPLIESQRGIPAEMNDATVYRIEFIVDDNLVDVEGAETVFYTNQEAEPLKEVGFRLFPNILGGEIEIRDLTVDGNPVSPRYELARSLMLVPLESPLAVGKNVKIAMRFSLRVPTEVELNYGVLASLDGVLTLAHAYPVIPAYTDEGWNAELPPQSGDVTFNDAAFYLVTITAPKDAVVVASGMESAPETIGRQNVWNVAGGPARDFFAAVSRDYEVVSQKVGEVTVNSYAPKSLQDGNQQILDVATRALETYNKLYAPYPYTELDLAVTPTLALGIEYPGAIAIAENLLLGEFGNQNSAYFESTVAHEVAHQWFYNLVGNDQLDEPWLDESLAQFATWEYYEAIYGDDGAKGFEDALRLRWERVEGAPIPVGMPVAKYSGLEYGAIVYGRGALFIDALREEMGAEAFDAFMKDYVASFSWQIATTDGLKAMAEKSCNCDLSALFDTWIY